jgi:RNA 3'-terminal phosphate cyclase (ATP)
VLILDGSQGEGGGQIVRTALTLSCITGTPFTIKNIRAGRSSPGLRPQHITSIYAAAEICQAEVKGVAVDSQEIMFIPRDKVRHGQYEWAVGTAGAATLVLQTVLLPLALAEGHSTIQIHGGTHVPFSPSAHYLRDVYIPLLLSLGVNVELYIEEFGWMPEGGGTLRAHAHGKAHLTGLDMSDRGDLERVLGSAVGCNLPSHIPQRITNRALNLLEPVIDVPLDIRPVRAKTISTGAGLFLAAEYANGRGGFGVLGRKGMPSEVVAEKAVSALLAFHDSDAALDSHLADQLVIPLALAPDESIFTTQELTPHLLTNIAVVQAFAERQIELDEDEHSVLFAAP